MLKIRSELAMALAGLGSILVLVGITVITSTPTQTLGRLAGVVSLLFGVFLPYVALGLEGRATEKEIEEKVVESLTKTLGEK